MKFSVRTSVSGSSDNQWTDRTFLRFMRIGFSLNNQITVFSVRVVRQTKKQNRVISKRGTGDPWDCEKREFFVMVQREENMAGTAEGS